MPGEKGELEKKSGRSFAERFSYIKWFELNKIGKRKSVG